jgi:hypothetical protein
MSISEFRIESEAELVLTLADDIEAELNGAIATRGFASLAVSGHCPTSAGYQLQRILLIGKS